MKYVVLVSHGTFAPGLKSVLAMLAGGEREDVISVGLEDGMSADTFAENFRNAISGIKSEDEIILLGDIIGGSPMTNALEQISKKAPRGYPAFFHFPFGPESSLRQTGIPAPSQMFPNYFHV